MEQSEIMTRYEQIVLNLLEDNEKLKSHVKKLEAALRDVLLWGDHCQHCDYDDDWEKIEIRAHKVLEGKDGEAV